MNDWPYNLTKMMNETQGIADMATSTDIILGGHWFGYFTLAILWIVVFVYLRRQYHPLTCAAGSCWITMLASWFLRSLGLIPNWVFLMCVISVPMMIFALWLSWRD